MSDKLIKDSVPVEKEQSVSIKMTVQELNVVLASLQEMPHKVVDGLIRSVYQQAQEQLGGQNG